MWWMLFPHWIRFLSLLSAVLHMGERVLAMTLPRATYSHAGICPNDMNPNLWVDAMSTCTRECDSDQECETFEKCCSNVCGNRSCVAARYMREGSVGPVGMPREATCDKFMCAQQGSQCDVWDGQPVCKCKDRCEKTPNFTCASDGMTYYNRCYMDAEACSKGISLSVVTCRFTWPNTSPLPAGTTTRPTTPVQQPLTTPVDLHAPVLVGTPAHQSVFVGETASFLCEVGGRPRPEVTWEKQVDGPGPDGTGEGKNVVMRPNHVRGNVVVTNIGQLVVYNAQLQDAGIYTCTAKNTAGSLQAHYPLSVLPPEPVKKEEQANATRFPVEECMKLPDMDDCAGAGAGGGSMGSMEMSETARVSWYYEAKRNNCFTFTHCPKGPNPSPKQHLNRFDTYESCMLSCRPELGAACTLPSLQGPCKAYEPRWAYSAAMGTCQSFVYGGCGGNDNNFETKEACEDACPFPKSHQRCRPCKPRHRMVTSFCRADFVVLGRVSEMTEESDSGQALITVEEILKDEKMGLRFFGKEPLEVTLRSMDWSCPCPNVTAADGQVIIMGEVSEGMAILQPDSFVSVSSVRRVRKLREVINKNTCDILKEFIQ